MELVAIITGLALLQVFYFAIQVGQQRIKHEVNAPAVAGAPGFDRAFRVHQNTIEQLIIFIPSLWMFAYFVRADVAAGLGLVFVIGRQVYRGAYVDDPSKRSVGFSIGALVMMILLIGGMVGAGIDLL